MTFRKLMFYVFALALASAGRGAMAADCAYKLITEDSKIQLADLICKPGEGRGISKKPSRGAYYIEGGTMERVYENGKKDTITRATGEEVLLPEATFSFKNIGKSTIHMFITLSK